MSSSYSSFFWSLFIRHAVEKNMILANFFWWQQIVQRLIANLRRKNSRTHQIHNHRCSSFTEQTHLELASFMKSCHPRANILTASREDLIHRLNHQKF